MAASGATHVEAAAGIQGGAKLCSTECLKPSAMFTREYTTGARNSQHKLCLASSASADARVDADDSSDFFARRAALKNAQSKLPVSRLFTCLSGTSDSS